ncbi:hypothetical protein CKF43_11525, partial [Pantoea graminicola]
GVKGAAVTDGVGALAEGVSASAVAGGVSGFSVAEDATAAGAAESDALLSVCDGRAAASAAFCGAEPDDWVAAIPDASAFCTAGATPLPEGGAAVTDVEITGVVSGDGEEDCAAGAAETTGTSAGCDAV